LEARSDVFEDDFKAANTLIENIQKDQEQSNLDWLVETTEKWCQEKALHGAILESITILDNKDGKKQTKSKGAIPQILTEALGVSFDPNVGHDYLEDATNRYEFYHRVERKIPFDLEYFNRITRGGLAPKTLSVILAGPNVGKSLAMCHFAASALTQNYNVLYITMEMSQERIASRIDANLLDTPLNTILSLPKDTYERKIAHLKSTMKGKLIVKEYPTAGASTIHFRNLLNELNLKKQFKPDLVCVDYLNICCSARLKMGATINSYTYVKAIAEELRGLAIEYNLPIISATQTTRSGYCLDLKTKVTINGIENFIENIRVGDIIDGQKLRTVKNVFPIVKKQAFRITLEDGKQIICSSDHEFPTSNGKKSIKNNLRIGDFLSVR
jgi:archaellum biogenesis ATPase FlaH